MKSERPRLPQNRRTGALHARGSVLAAAALVAAAACEPASGELDAKTKELLGRTKDLEAAFLRMQQTLNSAEAGPCSEMALRTAIAKSQSRRAPFADAPSLGRFATGQTLDPKNPLAHLVPKSLAARHGSSTVKDPKTATDAAYDALKLTKDYDFLAALKYRLTLPKADPKGFHGGELEGTLALFELKSGKLMCAAPVFAQSHSEIAGKPGQTPQDAADKDFDLELRRTLQEALESLTRELTLEFG